ncbi:MAG: Yip1 family protein [Chloroflexota bacterium]
MSSDQAVNVRSESFFQTWIQALTKPRETTYAALAASPKAKATTAYWWVFLCSFAPAVVSMVVSGSQLTRQLAEAGVDTGQLGGGLGAALINFLCIAPFAAVAGVAGFLISVALMQWIAKMFGGQGSFDQLAYGLGAITAPALLVSALLTLPTAIPFAGLCFAGLSAVFSIYVIVLEVMAIKGVHRFGWGPAIGTLIIPGLAIALVLCCAVAVMLSVTGLALGDVWNTINQSLMQ